MLIVLAQCRGDASSLSPLSFARGGQKKRAAAIARVYVYRWEKTEEYPRDRERELLHCCSALPGTLAAAHARLRARWLVNPSILRASAASCAFAKKEVAGKRRRERRREREKDISDRDVSSSGARILFWGDNEEEKGNPRSVRKRGSAQRERVEC